MQHIYVHDMQNFNQVPEHWVLILNQPKQETRFLLDYWTYNYCILL